MSGSICTLESNKKGVKKESASIKKKIDTSVKKKMKFNEPIVLTLFRERSFGLVL